MKSIKLCAQIFPENNVKLVEIFAFYRNILLNLSIIFVLLLNIKKKNRLIILKLCSQGIQIIQLMSITRRDRKRDLNEIIPNFPFGEINNIYKISDFLFFIKLSDF